MMDQLTGPQRYMTTLFAVIVYGLTLKWFGSLDYSDEKVVEYIHAFAVIALFVLLVFNATALRIHVFRWQSLIWSFFAILISSALYSLEPSAKPLPGVETSTYIGRYVGFCISNLAGMVFVYSPRIYAEIYRKYVDPFA